MRLLPNVGGLCCCIVALGQTESGSIAGSVFDPAHAPAAGVSVEGRNTETGTDYKAVSSAKGEYTLVQLPPGKYDIFVIDAKYRPFVRRGVVIRAATRAAWRFSSRRMSVCWPHSEKRRRCLSFFLKSRLLPKGLRLELRMGSRTFPVSG